MGKSSTDGGLGLCFACGQGGSRDGSSSKWRHVGNGLFWADLAEWAAKVGDGWVHERDLVEFPFQTGEGVCCRPTCVVSMYMGFKFQALKQEMGSLHIMVTGQSSPMGRYPSTVFQIRALLAHVEVEGGVLGCCGAAGDAVSTVLTAHSIHVTTNDFDPRMPANSHMDAFTDGCVPRSLQGGCESPELDRDEPAVQQYLGYIEAGVAGRARRGGIQAKAIANDN